MRSILPIYLVLAACGAKQPAPPALQPTLDPTAQTPEDKHEVDPDNTGTVGSTNGPRSFTMFPQLASYPLYVVDPDGLMLFDAEKLEASMMIATWARGAGFSVEDPRRTREIFSRAAHGQNVTTGKACGAPLWSMTAAARWRTELKAKGRIEVGAYCTPTCWLMVNVSEGLSIGLPDAGRTAFYAAPYDPAKPWRTELPAALARTFDWHSPGEPRTPLARVPGAELLAGKADVAFVAEDEPTLNVPAAALATAQKCVGIGSTGLVLEFDATGKVTRCEHDDRHTIANVAPTACVCGALMGTKSGPGTGAVMRSTLSISADPGAQRTKTKALVRALVSARRAADPTTGLYFPVVSDKSISEWENDLIGYPAAPCFVGATDDTKVEGTFTLTFDAAGAVTKTAMVRTGGTLTPAMQSCFEGVLKTIQAPCPTVAKSTAEGEFGISYDR